MFYISLFQMTILLRMEDKMNRQLTCPISPDDSAVALSHELVHLGFIHEVSCKPPPIKVHAHPAKRAPIVSPSQTDREKLATMIEDTLRSKQQQLLGAAAKMQSSGERIVVTDGSSGGATGSSDPPSSFGSSVTGSSSTSNHLHHHVPVNSAS